MTEPSIYGTVSVVRDDNTRNEDLVEFIDNANSILSNPLPSFRINKDGNIGIGVSRYNVTSEAITANIHIVPKNNSNPILLIAGSAANNHVITNDGKIGIGKTNPTSELDIVGTIKATNIQANGSELTSINANNVSSGTLAVARGGTGVTTSSGTGSVVLSTNPTITGLTATGTFTGTGTALTSLNASNASSGTLAVARGGTGVTTSSGTGSVVLNTNPIITGLNATGTFNGNGAALTTLNMNNAASGTLAVVRGGTGVTTSSGTGSVVLNTNPTMTGVTATGTFNGNGAGLTTLNMNNAASGTLPVARGGTGVTVSSGTGSVVLNTNPTITGATAAGTFSGNGAGLTTLNANNISSGVINNSLLPPTISISGSITASDGIMNTIGTSGATSFSIKTNNTDKLTVLSDGKVGIGNSNPAELLHVSGNARIEGNLTINGTTTIVNTNTSTTEQLIITNDGTGPAVIINQTGAQPVIDFQDDGVSVFYIEDGGNVGIGTTDPTQKLDVIGTIKATDFVGSGAGITSISAGNISSGILPVSRGGTGVTSTSGTGSLVFTNGATLTGLNATGTFNGNGASLTNLNMNNAASGTLPIARGGTGVGTSSGTGSVVFTNGATLTGLNATGTFNGNGAALANLNMSNAASGTLPIVRGGTGVTSSSGTGSIVFTSGATMTGLNATGTFNGTGTGLLNLNATNISSGTLNNSFLPTEISIASVTTSGNIIANGNIGIGTSTPTDKLDVNGCIAITSGTVVSDGTNVDAGNKTNTYLALRQAGSGSDWCYIRQIGGSNTYKLALDFHDDGNDARFCIRNVKSTATPDTITEVFTVDNGNVSFTGLLTGGTVPVARITGLSTVATSGSYTNLSDKPTLFTSANQYIQSVSSDFTVVGNQLAISSTFMSSQWITSGTSIYYNTGNVGIGIASPASPFHVVGDSRFDGNITVQGRISFISGGNSITGPTGGSGDIYIENKLRVDGGIYIGNATNYFGNVSGDNRGSVQLNGIGNNSWNGLNIDGKVSFILQDASTVTVAAPDTEYGIYDDANNMWGIKGILNKDIKLYYQGSEKLATTTSGILVTGELSATNDVVVSASDDRLKNRVETLTDVLPKLKRLDVFRYTFNDIAKTFGFDNTKVNIGLSAQQIKESFPELVEPAPFDLDSTTKESKSGENYLTLKYDKVVSILVQGIKELSGMNDELSSDVKTLKNEIDILKNQMTSILEAHKL